MFINGKQNFFITLKDHQSNFESKPTVRHLNPAKMNSVELVKNRQN